MALNAWNIKNNIIKRVFRDEKVDKFYRNFQKTHPGFTSEHAFQAYRYILRLNTASSKHEPLKTVPTPEQADAYYVAPPKNIRYFARKKPRKAMEALYDQLAQYDVISFDIFDTLMYRKVEFPNDVFLIMASEIGHNDFLNIRKKAEVEARDIKERTDGTREVVLSEIYDVLAYKYDIDPSWQNREIELELDLSVVNPYMKEIYDRLLAAGKSIIITSDMYLPKSTIEQMLHKHGYNQYDKFYLSNEYGLRKGDGTLQRQVLEDYPNTKIVHVGDSLKSDVEKSKECGLDAIHNPHQNLKYREPSLDGLAGSFYRAIINNTLNNGTWDNELHYEHGFRVGGILTTGFCYYLNKLSTEHNIDKILFCARDCEIISTIYKEYFNEFDNEYIETSRYAIMNAAPERYLYDLINRFIMRHADQVGSSRTIQDVLIESGYGYLVDYLEDDDIDKFLFPASIGRKKLEVFITNHKDVIIEHNQPYVAAAKQYFSEVIGNAKNILVVDIGWSGTCITALKYFIEKHFPEKNCNVIGALMCSSRNTVVTNSISDGTLYSYIYSPLENLDLARFMMPANTPALQQDLLHMPLEYMYTSVAKSLIAYAEDQNGNITFERTGVEPVNKEEILAMQQGMKDFVRTFFEYASNYKELFYISPYVAFQPLCEAIKQTDYTYEVYKNFVYDACTAPYADLGTMQKFSSLFETSCEMNSEIVTDSERKQILFVTPELTYTGTPRSLLRMCKVAVSLGYQPIVWSAKPGPFIAEYEQYNIPVTIVPENQLNSSQTVAKIKKFDMAICNTIVTDKYAKVCSKYIPVIWYIREATNIPDFCRNNPDRLFTLRHSKDLCCVSDYAADAIGKFTKNRIRVVHNSVEDEVDMALPYTPGTGDTVKFVQFGTMEYRKGYDVLLAAYKAMPAEYQAQSELYFAGGFINSGTPYCSYLFSKLEKETNMHYMGVVKGEQNKIEALSQMDVVVVASRDESCSLVALEGAMLSKPLIVTENVGAKYMIEGGNGIVTQTADVESLKCALMQMIDNKNNLATMGKTSRINYEKMASMASYTEDMKKLFALCNRKHTLSFSLTKMRNRFFTSSFYEKHDARILRIKNALRRKKRENVIVSLTSHPGRIGTVHITIDSLLNQQVKAKKVLLWLSKVQFPNLEKDLPDELLALTKNTSFEIRWADGDMAPHKKYLYTAKEYPEFPFIIVDDDVIYDETLVEKLMASYHKFPDCISCMRGNLMTFRPDGNFRIYDKWVQGYKMLLDIPTYQLLPTGVGGVLYPPHSLPEETFNLTAITETCLYCDDLWLKMMATYNNYRTVIPKDWCGYTEISGTQVSALWRRNVRLNNNDMSLDNILEYFDKNLCSATELSEKIRKDRFC